MVVTRGGEMDIVFNASLYYTPHRNLWTLALTLHLRNGASISSSELLSTISHLPRNVFHVRTNELSFHDTDVSKQLLSSTRTLGYN